MTPLMIRLAALGFAVAGVGLTIFADNKKEKKVLAETPNDKAPLPDAKKLASATPAPTPEPEPEPTPEPEPAPTPEPEVKE